MDEREGAKTEVSMLFVKMEHWKSLVLLLGYTFEE